MDKCCLEAFALKGIADGFQRAPEGEEFRCPGCESIYRVAGGKWTLEPPRFDCPRCGRRSYNFNDIRERYCGFCKEFF